MSTTHTYRVAVCTLQVYCRDIVAGSEAEARGVAEVAFTGKAGNGFTQVYYEVDHWQIDEIEEVQP